MFTFVVNKFCTWICNLSNVQNSCTSCQSSMVDMLATMTILNCKEGPLNKNGCWGATSTNKKFRGWDVKYCEVYVNCITNLGWSHLKGIVCCEVRLMDAMTCSTCIWELGRDLPPKSWYATYGQRASKHSRWKQFKLDVICTFWSADVHLTIIYGCGVSLLILWWTWMPS